MNREEKIALFQKWIEALRSGAYDQGRSALHKDGKYCCLGVLCTIAGAARRPAADLATIFEFEGTTSQSVLPDAFAKELGLDIWAGFDRPVWYAGDEATALTELNDAGAPFSAIADVIEEQFLKPLLSKGST